MGSVVRAYEVIAFSDDPHAGSPTGVVLDADSLTERQMRAIARELGFSHTAFVSNAPEPDAINIRFFTPLRELSNCGHATIAAHFLRATLSGDPSTQVVQHTLSGTQPVAIHRDPAGMQVFFQQNEITFSPVEVSAISDLLVTLNTSADALDSRFPVMMASPGANRFLVAFESVIALNALSPDFDALHTLTTAHDAIGCFAFAIERYTSPMQVSARMFAPAIGVNEDVINGNSSGCLGAYLINSMDTDSLEVHIRQGHLFGRAGTVIVRARRENDIVSTWVGGQAVMVDRVELAGEFMG